jgi:hypothetical protein
MTKAEKKLYNLVLKETQKQIKLNEALISARSISKLGKGIFKFRNFVKNPAFSASSLGVTDNFANTMKRRVRALDQSVDDVLRRTLGKKHWADWETSVANFKRDLSRVGSEIDRKITNLESEINIYRTSDRSHPKIAELEKNITDLEVTKRSFDDATNLLNNPKATAEDIIDMAQTIKTGRRSHTGQRMGRKPEEPATYSLRADGRPGSTAAKRGLASTFVSTHFTYTGFSIFVAMYAMSDYIEKAGYPTIAKVFKFNLIGLADALYEYGPAIIGALTNMSNIGVAADAKRTLENVETAKGWIEELILLKLIASNKDLTPPEGQKYTDKLQITYLTVNQWSVEKREVFLNQVDEVTENIAINREALEALADANPVIDGLFNASMAMYISKKTFIDNLGRPGKITIAPDPKKGFTRMSNCNAIKKAGVNLNKLEQSMPNDTDIRAFANYCDLVRFKPSSKDKATLVSHVMKGFTGQTKQAGMEVRSDLYANVKKD